MLIVYFHFQIECIYLIYPGDHLLYRMVQPGYPAKPFFRHYKMDKKSWEWFFKDLSYFY